MTVLQSIEKAAIPAIAYGLSLAVPVVPAAVWTALLNALLAGDITLEHIQTFMQDHNIKTYAAPTDFPDVPPQESPHNFTD